MSPRGAEEGFTLIEIVCVMAIISILAALILPAIPRGTSRTRLEAFALQTAALLKTDRLAAMQRRMQVATELDPISRSIRSGATGTSIVLPRDVGVRCAARVALQSTRRRTDDRFLSLGNVVRRHDRAVAAGGRFPGSRQLADRRG